MVLGPSTYGTGTMTLGELIVVDALRADVRGNSPASHKWWLGIRESCKVTIVLTALWPSERQRVPVITCCYEGLVVFQVILNEDVYY